MTTVGLAESVCGICPSDPRVIKGASTHSIEPASARTVTQVSSCRASGCRTEDNGFHLPPSHCIHPLPPRHQNPCVTIPPELSDSSRHFWALFLCAGGLGAGRTHPNLGTERR